MLANRTTNQTTGLAMSKSAKPAGRGRINPLAGVRNWDAQSRVTTRWQGLHNDSQLWFPDGDLLIFLFERGQSQRKPSFHIRTTDLRLRNFDYLLDACIVAQDVPVQIPSKAHPSTLRARMAQRKIYHELCFPPPPNSDSIAVLDYHLTTRNFFAWMYDVPMVGRSLGRALVSVLDRMNQYRPNMEQNRADLMTYLERQGYYDFRMCADHSLAALHFAETFEMTNLWKNAFAHSVGMCELLYSSGEYQNISRITRALITKTNIDMEAHLDRVTKSLGTFFEEMTSGALLGLGQAAREHIDQFRSFLISVHIERHGFWPPRNLERQNLSYPKATFMSLYLEFRCLYQFLVDPSSSAGNENYQPKLPGLDMEQLIQKFDQTHGFERLPHHLPLIPQYTAGLFEDEDEDEALVSPSGSRRGLNPLRRPKADRIFRRKALWKTLADATNYEPQIYAALIVRRYVDFEREVLIDTDEEKIKLSLTDGRRIRWLLVYGILQILISVVQAPNDVSDMDGVDYPLCCRLPKAMPWEMDLVDGLSTDAGGNISPEDGSIASGHSKSVKFTVEKELGNGSVHTNASTCSLESTSREGRNSVSATSSATSDEMPPSLPANVSKTVSPAKVPPKGKSSKSRSMLRFLGRRSSTPAADVVKPVTSTLSPAPRSTTLWKPTYLEISVPGYGNGIQERRESAGTSTNSATSDPDTSTTSPLSASTTRTSISMSIEGASEGEESSTKPILSLTEKPVAPLKPALSVKKTLTHQSIELNHAALSAGAKRLSMPISKKDLDFISTPGSDGTIRPLTLNFETQLRRSSSRSSLQSLQETSTTPTIPFRRLSFSEGETRRSSSKSELIPRPLLFSKAEAQSQENTSDGPQQTSTSGPVSHLPSSIKLRRTPSVSSLKQLSVSRSNTPQASAGPPGVSSVWQLSTQEPVRGRPVSHLPPSVRRHSSVSGVPAWRPNNLEHQLVRSRSTSRSGMTLVSAESYNNIADPSIPVSLHHRIPPLRIAERSRQLPEITQEAETKGISRSNSKSASQSKLLAYWRPNPLQPNEISSKPISPKPPLSRRVHGISRTALLSIPETNKYPAASSALGFGDVNGTTSNQTSPIRPSHHRRYSINSISPTKDVPISNDIKVQGVQPERKGLNRTMSVGAGSPVLRPGVRRHSSTSSVGSMRGFRSSISSLGTIADEALILGRSPGVTPRVPSSLRYESGF